LIRLVFGSLLFFDFTVVVILFFFFFFQAEDGIRDRTVTGVQTCALPIFDYADDVSEVAGDVQLLAVRRQRQGVAATADADPLHRSEERRVGKECRSRGAPDY